MVMNATDWADKWQRRLKGAGEDIKKGVQGVTVAPSQLAIAKKEKMRTNLMAALDSGKWEAGLQGFTLADYKRLMESKGIPNLQRGVDEGVPKVQKYAVVAIPHIESGKAMIAGMPDLTLEDSKARASKWIEHMASLRYRK